MRKFISTILSVILAVSCICVLSAYAETEELLTNGDFEEGSNAPFQKYGHASIIEVEEDYAHSGDYGAAVRDRQGVWACWQQNIRNQVKECGPGDYKASAWVKLSDEGGDANCILVINYKQNGWDNDKYLTSPKKNLTNEWQEFTINGKLEYDQEKGLEHVYVYVQVVGNDKTSAPSYYMDDFSVKKTSEVNGVTKQLVALEHKQYSTDLRSEKTSVGVIRWDAWYGHDGKPTSIISQVEKTLSPAEYHFRAPFFAKVTDDGKIEIPEYTQEIFDKEMAYAAEAGIDYFAFLMYSDDMKKAREFYKKSSLNNKVKMCCVVSPDQDKFYNEVVELFKQDYYMTVLDDRPLLYIYVESEKQLEKVSNDIAWYRTLCAENNIKEPYVAVMTSYYDKVHDTYADSAARYGVAGTNGEPFANIITKAKQMWAEGKAKCGQVVPNVSFGWDTVPRAINPVSWMTASKNSYAAQATEQELYEFVKAAFDFTNDESNKASTLANTITIDAWNEHDEGGWICPTIECDKDGNQLFNDDGTPKINRTHLDALKRAIQEYKSGNIAPAPTDNAGTQAEATPTPDNTVPDAGNGANGANGALVWIIIGAVLVVGGGISAAVIVARKKKNEKS